MAKKAETLFYSQEFQQKPAPAPAPGSRLRNLMSSQKPVGQKLYGPRFQERKR